MPGVPRIQRCVDCKRRKIKCDLQWPSCTPCAKAGIQCAGPSSTTKFIQVAHSTASESVLSPSSSSSHSRSASPASSLSKGSRKKPPGYFVALDTRNVEGGASYGYFRFSSGPKKYPTTLCDRLSAQLVRAIDKDISGQIIVNADYMKFIPSRMERSAALRDCVALFCSAWSGYRRSEFSRQALAPSTYGKALRSLQRALYDPDAQLTCETLAAVTLMERCNVLFDSDASHQPLMHARGIEHIMRTRGPPAADDDLDMQLAIDNHGVLLGYWAMQGGENFYLRPQWKEVMDCWASGSDSVRRPSAEDIVLNDCFSQWPDLVHNTREVLKDPQDDGMRILAAEVYLGAIDLDAQAHNDYVRVIQSAYEDGMLTKAPFWECEERVDPKYQPSEDDLRKMERLSGYITLEIFLTRMMHTMLLVLGRQAEAESILERNYSACQLSMHMVSSLRKLGPIASMMYLTPCYLAYEIIEDPAVQWELLSLFSKANGKTLLPEHRPAAEIWLANTARAMTGRKPVEQDVLSSPSTAELSPDSLVVDPPSQEEKAMETCCDFMRGRC